MTGAVAGLLLGLGLFCLWWSWWPRSALPPARPAILLRLEDDLVQAGLDGLTPARLALASVGTAGLIGLCFLALTGVLPVSAAFAVASSYGPVAIVRARALRRRRHLRDVWPDVVDDIASAVRAGLALPEALGQVGSRGPEELRPAFAAFAEDYRATGRYAACLDRLKERLADPVADRLVESLRIARDVGGSDLGRLLRTLSTFLRDDARTRAELEARQSWTVNAARLAVAAPWLVLAMLSTRPDAARAYAGAEGVLILAVGGGVTVLAYRLMVRLGRLPQDERVLR